MEVHNNTPFSGRDYSRREQFEEIERIYLSGLNPIRYELKKQSVVTVMKNGHIKLSDDHHYYSVPRKYIRNKVKLLYTSLLVEFTTGMRKSPNIPVITLTTGIPQ